MRAKTILLPKTDNPCFMNQIRPITIITALFRLYGKVVFRKVADSWSQTLPKHIMGGLPGRGVKDLAFLQKFNIESAIMSSQPLTGFSPDLVKAFNTFGRRFLAVAMIRLGMPNSIVSFWIRSLSHLVRHPVINNKLGPGVASTCGAPEGDSISVLSMLALSAIYFFRISTVDPCVQPYIYADNWAWTATCGKAR